MDIHEAKQFIDVNDVTIVDIRDENSFQAAHIENALNLNDTNLNEFIDKTDKLKPVLCYCYHGFSSQQAAEFLRQNGFGKVFSMDGGFEAWKNVYPGVGSS